ncbi:MAG: hypothetical protein ACTHU0_34575, partial [Kofleriaceae bacterium]
MGWTAYYQILRDRPLEEPELVQLVYFIDSANRPPWECEGFRLAVTRDPRADGVIGYGWTKVPFDVDESTDHERLCEVLTALLGEIPGIEVRLSDDFGAFGWDPALRMFSLHDAPGPPLVELPDADLSTFAPPSALVSSPVKPLSDEALAFVDEGEADEELAARMLIELSELPDDHPDRGYLRENLAGLPARTLAVAGLSSYGEIGRSYAVWQLVCRAIDQLEDIEPLVEPFLALWRAPRGIYWYGDLSLSEIARERLARSPQIEAQLLADLADSLEGSELELVHRRAEHAALMLGRSGSRAAQAALVEATRVLRDRPVSSNQRAHTARGVLGGLVLVGRPLVVPSLLLAVGTDPAFVRHQHEPLEMLARLAPHRVHPLLTGYAALGEHLWAVIP